MGLVALILAGCAEVEAARRPLGGAVAADHPLASEAGAEALRAGGNAVDAAIAAALSSGVVQPAGSGLGGGGFAIVVAPDGGATVLDFREVAPAAATVGMFQGGASSRLGGLAVAVPVEGIGLAELHRRFGRLPARKVVSPAVVQAERGFETGAHLAKGLLDHPDMAALFSPGNRRPALARALRSWAESHGEAFRTGWVAKDLVAATRAAGGILTEADLAAYQVVERTPLRGAYGPWSVITMPPPSSGGFALLQMLGATAGVDRVACDVEAAKFAMATRAAQGGDPAFVTWDVAAELAPARLDAVRADCGARTFPPDHYAPPSAPPSDAGTLHISVMDAEGWAVALTTTINTSFGSKVIAPESGIVLNNQMDDFAARPGEPNAFGLVQGVANAVAPGKRPLSSMTPTVVLDASGRAAVVVGGSGGPTIITATFQVLRAVLDDAADPSVAVSAPRWHHQWLPDKLFVEPAHPDRAAFEAAGHVVQEQPAFSAVQVVVRRDGAFSAASDPRKGGAPAIVAPQ